MRKAFSETSFLGTRTATTLLAKLETTEITGGAVYNALVGDTAKEHQLTLVARDRRAGEVYNPLGVDTEGINV
ncbi:hypothetical protein MUBE_00045 [Mycobacterium uberis]|uniref:Uncharacterized protein n=1 Tax=Mycobacterium uberis TaxID=2162698 RepID=A0A3E1HLI2_9MYCO|nr:hypothetical protein [Mycobacterium uberis]RFD27105.1 hypothetical protein MUBE_00045 [Mycobacterium uberis]